MTARFLALLLAAGAVTACSSDTSDPVSPTVVPTTSFTYSTSFTARGSATRSFDQIDRGPVNLTLTSVTPEVPLGVGIGIPNLAGTDCQMTTAAILTPSTSPQITLTAEPGLWCVRVWDPGTVPEVVHFSISVVHN